MGVGAVGVPLLAVLQDDVQAPVVLAVLVKGQSAKESLAPTKGHGLGEGEEGLGPVSLRGARAPGGKAAPDSRRMIPL